jgi:glycosyltransferase involved in cell wall biosynthesis
MNNTRRSRIALLVNMVSPARISLYTGLAKSFDLLILHGGTERNRDSWRNVHKMLPLARVVKVWGWQIPITRRMHGQTFDERYLHFHPGYLWHLLRFRPDAIITNEMGARTLIALIYGTVFHKPVWVWWGGTVHTENKKSGFLRRSLRWLLSCWVEHWISYGRSSTEYLLMLGVSQRRILELQNTADERYSASPAQPKFDLQPRPILLYVGQFIARKGVDLLLQAAATLQRQGAEFSLLLVGSGRGKQATERLADELGLRNVHFHPSQTPSEMPAVYSSADVLVFPTLEDPWGLVANEAILSGLPVLCSKYAGCAEELFSSDSIFDPEKADEFVERLRIAVRGRLPKSDLARLKTNSQIISDLVAALNSTIDRHLEPAAVLCKEPPDAPEWSGRPAKEL